jgi:hypothetical protein
MESKHSEFLLNSRNLQLTIYISVVVANFLFVLLYPEHIVIGATGAIFFSVLLVKFWLKGTKKYLPKESEVSQKKSLPTKESI